MKHFIQKSALLFSLSVVFLFPQKTFGAHLFGTDMSYQCTATPNVYLVRVKVYRDCSGSQLCTNCPTGLSASCQIALSLTGGASSCNGTNFGTQNINVLVAQSAFDIVQLCASQKTICTNCGTRTAGSFTPGVEVYTFEGTISLVALASSNPNCCLVKIGYSSGSNRNTNITTISNPASILFYSECIINRCATPCNSSPVFNSPIDIVVCSGIDQNLNIAAVDPDGDSLSYNLASALSNTGSPVPYTSPYSAIVPFPYLGSPIQSPPATLPVGMRVNAITGDIQFRPSGNFIAPVVIEVKQWKNIGGVASLMGSTKRDYTIYSQTCPVNSPVIFKRYDTTGTLIGTLNYAGDSLRICPGERICRIFVAADTTQTDSTDITWSSNTNMTGATFASLYNSATRNTNGPRQDSFKFCWTAPLNAGSLNPYVFTVTGMDRFCSMMAKTVRSVSIYVTLPSAAIITKTALTKTSYKLKYVKTNSSLNIPSLTQWQIETASGSNTFTTFNTDSINNYVFPISGKYKIKLILSNATCGTVTILDSITVNFLTLSLVSKSDVTCKGDSTGSAVFSSVGGAGTIRYKLNNGTYQTGSSFNKITTGSYLATVSDSFNTTDTIRFNIAEPSTVLSVVSSNIVNLKCKGDSIGRATLTTTNGTAPFQYKVLGSTYQNSNVLTNLKGGNNMLIVSDSNNCKASTNVVITEPNNKLSGNLQLVSPLCNGGKGSANLSASGGNTPYQYRIDSGAYNIVSSFANLNAKAYTFNIKDWNGCELGFAAPVTEPSPLLVNGTKNNISCNGLTDGKVTLNTSGATPPYQYKKGTGVFGTNSVFNSLPAGIYGFTIKDSNACIVTTNITISQPAALSKTFSFTNAACLGATNGTATITVAGGTLPYSYTWNTTPVQTTATATVLPAGLVIVTVKDSSLCAISDSGTIGYKPLYNNEQICAVTIDTSTGKNIVVWNKTAGVGIAAYKIFSSPVAGGPFSVVDSQLYNNLSTFKDIVSTPVKKSFYYYLKAIDSCGNESTASGTHQTMYGTVKAITTNKNTLTWNTYSGIAGAVSQNILRSINNGPFINIKQLPLTAITYTDSLTPAGVKRYLIELELSANCNPTLNKAAVIHIYSNLMDMGATGLMEQANMRQAFEVYPNPTTGAIKINTVKAGLYIESVSIINMLGATVISKNIQGLNQEVNVDMDELADGVYHVLIKSGKGVSYPVKVLLNRGR
ncbi:MAG: T9SS type A sorting domain-containing protein [Bacteroidia bacterium]|nr:T9SS type A sorting domain-containing protein [Bacteroidia bacterium]